jgi:hypothetical protein
MYLLVINTIEGPHTSDALVERGWSLILQAKYVAAFESTVMRRSNLLVITCKARDRISLRSTTSRLSESWLFVYTSLYDANQAAVEPTA